MKKVDLNDQTKMHHRIQKNPVVLMFSLAYLLYLSINLIVLPDVIRETLRLNLIEQIIYSEFFDFKKEIYTTILFTKSIRIHREAQFSNQHEIDFVLTNKNEIFNALSGLTFDNYYTYRVSVNPGYTKVIFQGFPGSKSYTFYDEGYLYIPKEKGFGFSLMLPTSIREIIKKLEYDKIAPEEQKSHF